MAAEAAYSSFRDMMSPGDEGDNVSEVASVASSSPEAMLSQTRWEDRVRAKMKDAMFTASAVNEYGEKLIAFLDANAHHPLDVQYYHSHLGEEPRSMRDKDETPLFALISRKHELECSPESLRDDFAEHIRQTADWTQFNELEFIRSTMAFVATRMFKYKDERRSADKKRRQQNVAVVPPSTPATRASTDYSRFANIDDEESEEERD